MEKNFYFYVMEYKYTTPFISCHRESLETTIEQAKQTHEQYGNRISVFQFTMHDGWTTNPVEIMSFDWRL